MHHDGTGLEHGGAVPLNEGTVLEHGAGVLLNAGAGLEHDALVLRNGGKVIEDDGNGLEHGVGGLEHGVSDNRLWSCISRMPSSDPLTNHLLVPAAPGRLSPDFSSGTGVNQASHVHTNLI